MQNLFKKQKHIKKKKKKKKKKNTTTTKLVAQNNHASHISHWQKLSASSYKRNVSYNI
jgi:hypothetical protein